MKTSRKINMFISLVLTGIIAYLAITQISFAEIFSKLKDIETKWIGYAIIAYAAANVLWIIRWRVILSSFKHLSFINLLSAAFIGKLGNNIFPAKMGELVRVYVLSKREMQSKTAIISSIFVEKMLESFTLVIMVMLLSPFLINLVNEKGNLIPPEVVIFKSIYIFIIFHSVAISMIAVLLIYRDKLPRIVMKLFSFLPAKYLEKISDGIELFSEGISIFKDKKGLFKLVVISFFHWSLVSLRIYFTVKAFLTSIPYIGCFLIILCILILSGISTIPGNVGIYHIGSIIGLSLLSVEMNTAISIAVLLHGIPYIASTLAGLFFLWREHLRPFDLSHIAEKHDFSVVPQNHGPGKT